MSKFGELIDLHIPVLLVFYASGDEASGEMDPVLREVATQFGARAKVIKIDVEKNPELAGALRVKTLPTLMIYREGEMKWRQSGRQDSTTLTNVMREHIIS